MDVANLIATVNDPVLRREIMMGMDEASIAALPPHLLAEAQQFMQEHRQQRRDIEARIERAQRLGGGAGLFGERDPHDLLAGRYGYGGRAAE
jgi:hypothetical protein